MLDSIGSRTYDYGFEVVEAAARRVARGIAPVWDLSNYVAVNPFLGLASRPIAAALRDVGEAAEARVLPSLDDYRRLWSEGAFGRHELDRAAIRLGFEAEDPAAILDDRAEIPLRAVRRQATFAERVDRRHGGNRHEAIVRSVARWCAAHLSSGTSEGLYEFWLRAARVDRTLEIAGLRGWRAWMRTAPEDPADVLAEWPARLGVPAEELDAYLNALLSGLRGWAACLRRECWQSGDDGPGGLLDLLAVRVAADAAAVAQLPLDAAIVRIRPPVHLVEDEATRLVFQEAWEDAYADELIDGFRLPPPRKRQRPSVQAVFCIDVRSERIRRRLEEVEPTLETMGFAGFFGLPLSWEEDGAASARCPVLLKPSWPLRPESEGRSEANDRRGGIAAWKSAPASAFSFVELFGLGYAYRLARDAFALRKRPASDERVAPFDGSIGLEPAARLDLAFGLLKNLGLRDRFARLILLCGHEGRSSNNTHAAGLQCGACGGHGGALNARAAARLLNDPEIRAGLVERGRSIPDDVWFVAGVHDTAVDDVVLLDPETTPTTHSADLERLRAALGRAGAKTRAERAPKLGLPSTSDRKLRKLLERRAADWAETRPEWALARNAAFIAARRDRTRCVDLDGRAFLHEYDRNLDGDGSVLASILAAPMVVASWINLQYFASTVDNEHFGAGDKALHNRVGTLGVVLGNGGDLRTGLALQSVHRPNGEWFHEPLRLHVFVEADPTEIDAALRRAPSARKLVENGWVRLFALHPERDEVALRLVDGGWEPRPRR